VGLQFTGGRYVGASCLRIDLKRDNRITVLLCMKEDREGGVYTPTGRQMIHREMGLELFRDPPTLLKMQDFLLLRKIYL
jgi:hypothetical protein